ncbi:MAG: c-type cytochrome [Chitinophagaceae bacterium]
MKPRINTFYSRIIIFYSTLVLLLAHSSLQAQEAAKEEDFFRIMKVSSPEGTLLEVGGLCTLPNGDLAVTTRRGDIYIVENPTSQRPHFRKFASGLHEVLGIAYKDGALYCVQRGELTKLVDKNMDGKADVFETIYQWPLSGNYHEYSFGPKIAPDGSFFVTLNLGFPNDWWHPKSMVPWRGWALRIQEDGTMEPWAAGMRSPCGISMIDGELYYTDNQGDWVASGSIMPLKKGTFAGHPASLVWDTAANSPVKVKQEQIFSMISERREYDKEGRPVKPQNIVNEKFMTKADMKKNIPELQLPLVWLPHGILGISTSEIVKIPQGAFGPFQGQLLIGDQGQSILSRVFLEQVKGEWQGAAWMFRSGFQSGTVRMSWAKDGSLFVGETNRGWGSAGDANEGLQRLVWNGRIPFEMRTVKAMPDGFEIEFTKPVDKKYAEDVASYSVESFTYKYHAVYGSPAVNNLKLKIRGVKVSPDGMRVRIVVDNLRQQYIHTITLEGVRDKENAYSLVHPTVYYTLNNIPEGQKLSQTEISTKNSALTKSTGAVTGSTGLTYTAVKPLLTKYTCVSCHNPTKKQVGPSFTDIANRKYTSEKMIQLIYNPQPQNWPGYAVSMPPMSQVPRADAQRIVAWISTLQKK